MFYSGLMLYGLHLQEILVFGGLRAILVLVHFLKSGIGKKFYFSKIPVLCYKNHNNAKFCFFCNLII